MEFICDEYGIGELCPGKVLKGIAQVEHDFLDILRVFDSLQGLE